MASPSKPRPTIEARPMRLARAVVLGVRALDEQIHRLAVEANLHDRLGLVTAPTVQAAKQRARLRQARDRLRSADKLHAAAVEALLCHPHLRASEYGRALEQALAECGTHLRQTIQ